MARGMADSEGNIDKGSLVNLVRQNKKLRKTAKVLVALTSLLLVGIVAVGVGLSNGISTSGKTTQTKIEESVNTKVESDMMGAPHLVDKATGSELTVRNEGDSFEATIKFDAKSGRRLQCIPIQDVAKMVHDLSSGTPGSVVIKDELGIQKDIMTVEGNFHDEDSVLQFASFRVVMDSDACDRALEEPPSLDDTAMLSGMNGTDLKNGSSTLAQEDSSALEVEEDTKTSVYFSETTSTQSQSSNEEEKNDIFKRRLRNPALKTKVPRATDTRASALTALDVLERHRLEYAMAHAAIREGRHLEASSTVPLDTAAQLGIAFNILSVTPNGKMAMGVKDCTGTETSGYPRIVLQPPDDSDNQQFYVQDDQIVSKLCPDKSIHIHGGQCTDNSMLTLRSNTGTIPDQQKWIFNDDGMISKKCPGRGPAIVVSNNQIVLWLFHDEWFHKWVTSSVGTHDGVPIDYWTHPNGSVSYFAFDVAKWIAYFGSFTHQETRRIKQFRGGQEIASGTVIGFYDEVVGYVGRWDPNPINQRYFLQDDIIAYDGVPIDFWTHPNGGVSYFAFDVAKWIAYFGSFTHQETRPIKQYRGGKEIASGTVIGFYDEVVGYVGRWDPNPINQRYFLQDDVIAYDGVPIDYWTHPNGSVSYFAFDVAKWIAYFGSFTHQDTQRIKQLRGGKEIASGTVIVFYDEVVGYVGRWEPNPINQRYFLQDDVFVLDNTVEHGFLCGMESPEGIIDDFLNPPKEIQDILAIAFGVSYGIGVIGEFSTLDGQTTTAQQECLNLQRVMGKAPAVWVKLTQAGQLDTDGMKLLMGPAADDKIHDSCTRECGSARQEKSSSQVPKKAQSTALGEIGKTQPSILPLCMAVRPCRADDPSTFKQGVSFGVFFGGLEIPVKPYLNFKFHGIAASTFGDLTPMSFGAELWGAKKLNGAHLHIEWEINTRLGFKDLSLGTLQLLVQSQIYGEIDGSPDAGQLISGLLTSDSNTATPFSGAFLTARQPQSALLQIAANADLNLVLKLHEIFKLKGIEIEVPMTLASASLMFEYKYTRDNAAQTWFDCRFSVAKDVGGGIKKGVQKFLDGYGLGSFMKILNAAIDTYSGGRSPMTGKIMLRVYENGDFDFGLEASLNFLTGGLSWCGGPFISYVTNLLDGAKKFLNWVKTAGAVALAALPGASEVISAALDPIIDGLTEFTEIINDICFPQTPPTLRVAFLKNQFSLGDTCLIVDATLFGGQERHELCLDMIPTCQGPSELGEKCSENSDCTSGYCLNNEDLWTSVACLGTCMEKLDDGASCSDKDLYSFTGFHTAEHAACKSGRCLCGICAESDGIPALFVDEWTHPNGGLQYFKFDKAAWTKYFGSFNHGETRKVAQYRGGQKIDSGDIIVWDDVDVGTVGRWDGRTLDPNIRYWQQGDIIIKKNLSPGLLDESRCSENDDCQSGYCLGWSTIDCNGKCTRKAKVGECCSAECAKDVAGFLPTGAADPYCESNSCICNVCANTNGKLPDGKACATNANCISGYCLGWSSSGCTGTCTPKAKVGECCSAECAQDFMSSLATSAADAFCTSNRCICSVCANTSGKLPDGKACATNDNCISGKCWSKVHGCDGICGPAHEWTFKIDLHNDDYLDGGGGTWNAVQFEFYHSGTREVKSYDAMTFASSQTYNIVAKGPVLKPDYIVVKTLGPHQTMGIDQAGFYSTGDQMQWWGTENEGSFMVGYMHSNGPCLKFKFDGKVSHGCGAEFKLTGYDAANWEALKKKYVG